MAETPADRDNRYQDDCKRGAEDRVMCDKCGKDEGYDIFYGDAGDKVFGKCRACGRYEHFGYSG